MRTPHANRANTSTSNRSKAKARNALGDATTESEASDHTSDFQSPDETGGRSLRDRSHLSRSRSQSHRGQVVPDIEHESDSEPLVRQGRSRRSDPSPQQQRQQQQNVRHRTREEPQPGPSRQQAFESRAEPSRRRKQTMPKKRDNLKWFREVRRYQHTTRVLLPKLPFARCVRECLQQSRMPDARITKDALEALQEASEYYLTYFFEDANRLAIHAKRVTLMVNDMQLISLLRKNWNVD